jgi:molybdopterin/thiamine biosynthesis adenylyltransferase
MTSAGKNVILRTSRTGLTSLWSLVSSRYPDQEWATFARFGWRETSAGLVVTLAALDPPVDGDLDPQVSHVKIDEQYTLRIALAAEAHKLAVGVIHSHPAECRPLPSRIDDDMDRYYGRYFGDFAPHRPYVSLIMSRVDDELVISGRVFWQGAWWTVRRSAVLGESLVTQGAAVRPLSPAQESRVSRLSSAFGRDAALRLRNSSVTVIGAGGTGSAAIESLARAGVGRLVLVDPDFIEASNLERVHGSTPDSVARRMEKVLIAKEHVHSIDPDIQVTAIVGALPQREVVDAALSTDVLLGCTDSHHSRAAFSDLAFRYLLPALDCGVALEGAGGRVTGQVAQFVRLLPEDPCVYCLGMINSNRLSRELMSPEEREQRKQASADALARGDDGNAYWSDTPQINTVGYLTTAVGAMAAGYAIGWLTNRFAPPFARLQMNLVAPLFDVTEQNDAADPDCLCRRTHGWSDQAHPLVTAPSHWPEPREV